MTTCAKGEFGGEGFVILRFFSDTTTSNKDKVEKIDIEWRQGDFGASIQAFRDCVFGQSQGFQDAKLVI